MNDYHLHIVSFTIPYPPNYGGVIDVYCKLRALHDLGIRIHLHCFEYDRKPAGELNELCESVHYYQRKTGLRFTLSRIPYIVSSRRSKELISNLSGDNHPVLFEGLHSCYYLSDPRLRDKQKIYRESNIEHHYYYNLCRAEKNILKKLYFLAASVKLRHYEKILGHADLMLAVSAKDAEYLQHQFPGVPVFHLPSFHFNDKVDIQPGRGNYCLYHGNLSVAENSMAAAFLIREVFNDLEIDLKIAGLNPPGFLKKLARNHPHIQIIENPDAQEMERLIRQAHINILITFQATGLKLKLLNSLHIGRFLLVNSAMLNGTGLAELCEIADTPEQIKVRLASMKDRVFEEAEIVRRSKILAGQYSNLKNADRLIEYIF
ncbi:MAG: glycosyltransferase family 1 protein [Bacteroidales bacterium]|nr:glycosyltransferase family 1 protein [Lentimicrobiaceae bacterium]MDD5695349.1 glycosyltransferase family 1 protein [Bacteroidales bacterium]